MPDQPTNRPKDQKTNRLTCAILGRNVADHITDCVESCTFADRIVLFDSASDDGTQEFAIAAGAEVIDIPFINFSQARNAALEALDTEWVLFIDHDERVTPELEWDIETVVDNQDVDGWWVPRYNYIVGHKMQGGGWYPDHQLRLMRREKAHYDPAREVHELAIIDGPEDKLRGHLTHYNYESWAQFHAKQRRYTAYEAATLRSEGVIAEPRHLLTRPTQAFWRRFITWQGYHDEWHGLRLSAIMAYYEFLKYWWLWRSGDEE